MAPVRPGRGRAAVDAGRQPPALPRRRCLQVFGEVLHRRRKRRHGRKKGPGLKPPAGLLAGVVHKVRDASGNVVKVRARALFGRLKAIKARVVALGIGTTVNTSHLERLNGTLRCQQARLARRPRCVSRDGRRLQWSLWLWRDLVQLGAGPRVAGGPHAGDGDGPERAGLVGPGVRPLPGPCRRPHAGDLGRGAGECANFGPGPSETSKNRAIIVMDYQSLWQNKIGLIDKITTLHDVSKHRETIYRGGKARLDPPPGFYESLKIPDDPSMRTALWPMAEIILMNDPKSSRKGRVPTPVSQQELLETLADDFMMLIHDTGNCILKDAKANIALNVKSFQYVTFDSSAGSSGSHFWVPLAYRTINFLQSAPTRIRTRNTSLEARDDPPFHHRGHAAKRPDQDSNPGLLVRTEV